MSPQNPEPSSPGVPSKDSSRSPMLLIVILVIIVLGIASFLLIRPGGKGASQTNPAAPAKSQH